MKIIGIDGMTRQQLADQLKAGAKFVMYQYCVSIVVMTFKRGSDIYFIPAGGKGKGASFTAISLLAGWWGIPWGPIYTISSVVKNMQGGIDVTGSVWNQLNAPAPAAPGN
jgi:hypothetical protein